MLEARTPADLSTAVASVFWTALLVLGIYRCARSARREDSNAECAYSLMLTLIAWLIATWLGNIHKFVGIPALLWVVVGTLLIVHLLSCLVLAVIGLVIRAQRPQETRGTGHAIWAIVISLALTGLLVGGAVAGYLAEAGETDLAARLGSLARSLSRR